MDLNIGDVVSIRHYSGSNLLKTLITATSVDSVSIKITREFSTLNFFEGDPVVLLYEVDSNIYTASCNISHISLKQNTLQLKFSYIELLTDKRRGERFSVSLYCDIRIKGSSKKEIASVKNMSSDGIMVCTKAGFELGQDLEIDLYIDKTLVFVKADVIWKLNNPTHIEYGLTVYYPNLQVRNLVKRHLQALKDEQEKFIHDLKNTPDLK